MENCPCQIYIPIIDYIHSRFGIMTLYSGGKTTGCLCNSEVDQRERKVPVRLSEETRTCWKAAERAHDRRRIFSQIIAHDFQFDYEPQCRLSLKFPNCSNQLLGLINSIRWNNQSLWKLVGHTRFISYNCFDQASCLYPATIIHPINWPREEIQDKEGFYRPRRSLGSHCVLYQLLLYHP